MIRMTTLSALLIGLSGCGVDLNQIGREPQLTPVGSGLMPERVPIATRPTPRPVYRRGNSLWQDTSADLFRDPRASRPGDIVTVKISIKDSATLDTRNNRAREAEGELDASLKYDLTTTLFGQQRFQAEGSGSLNPKVESSTSTKSTGNVTRKESIELLVAALVTDVLPNGNLVVSGSQEVRVNFEMRVLGVAGVVRPRDIATDNTISYDKVAEARISYGGRGRAMEVQQPAWGQQLIDLVTPY
jgi:flagellar L-ring protein precursor FlgH